MNPGARHRAGSPGGAIARVRVRRATARDLPLLVEHRRRMWAAIGGYSRRELRASDIPYHRWLRREVTARRLVAFIAEARGAAVGSGGLWLAPAQPRPGRFAAPYLPYILSMFTEPRWRGHGIASALVRAMLRWVDRRGLRSRVYLHASRAGRPVYARLGFREGREMVLDLEHGVPARALGVRSGRYASARRAPRKRPRTQRPATVT